MEEKPTQEDRTVIDPENFIWKGRNYLFCDAKIITGPQGIRPVLVTSILILIPIVLLFVSKAAWFWKEISPWIVIALGLHSIFLYASLFAAVLIDPGILRRRQTSMKIPDRKRFLINCNGYFITTKLCESCFIIRPPRSHHCADCDNCVERFDHHCQFFGGCVGKRNYPLFFLFLFLLNLEIVYLISMCTTVLANALSIDFKDITKKQLDENAMRILMDYNLIPFFIIIYCLLFMVFTLRLFIYHICLVFSNLTTKEEVYKHRHLIQNLYDRGDIFYNISQALFPRKRNDTLKEDVHKRGSGVPMIPSYPFKNDGNYSEIPFVQSESNNLSNVDNTKRPSGHLNKTQTFKSGVLKRVLTNISNSVKRRSNNNLRRVPTVSSQLPHFDFLSSNKILMTQLIENGFPARSMTYKDSQNKYMSIDEKLEQVQTKKQISCKSSELCLFKCRTETEKKIKSTVNLPKNFTVNNKMRSQLEIDFSFNIKRTDSL